MKHKYAYYLDFYFISKSNFADLYEKSQAEYLL